MWKVMLLAVMPPVLQALEDMFATRPGDNKQGKTKLGIAISLAQNLLIAAATTSKVAAEEAADLHAISMTIQELVDKMQKEGKLGGAPAFKQIPVSKENEEWLRKLDKVVDLNWPKAPESRKTDIDDMLASLK